MVLAGTSRGREREGGSTIMLRRLSVLLHHVAVLRRHCRVTMSFLCRGLRDPTIREALLRFPCRRLIWLIHLTVASQRGFWEWNVLGRWRVTAQKYARLAHSVVRGEEYLNRKYVEMFRVDCVLFDWLLELCGPRLTHENTNMRSSIPPEKRLGIILHWLGHGFAERQLANLYHIGPSTVNVILHHGIAMLFEKLVSASIRFPQGEILKRDIAEFRQLYGLQQCARSLDRTFMKIQKPVEWGNHYWC